MRLICTILVIALVAAQSATLADDKPPVPPDADLIQGRWRLEDITIDGENERNTASQAALVAMLRASTEWVFSRDACAVRSKGAQEVREFRYKLYPDRSPKEYDAQYVGTDVEDKEYFRQGVRGIYSLEGDRMVRCYSEPGHPRPARFESEKGSFQTLQVLKRKPATDK